MYLNFNSQQEDRLYDILNDNDIDYDIQEAGLWIDDDDVEKTETLLKRADITFEFDEEGCEESVVRALIDDTETAEELLDEADIDYDYDDGGRMMISGNHWMQTQRILNEAGIDYDEI
jgi:hypothetical protein